MGIYNKPSQQTVFDLIVAENPALANATLAQFAIDKMTVVSGASTSVRVRGKPGSGFTGVNTVVYNRVSLGSLFQSVSGITLTQYTASKLSDLLPAFNAKYGLSLTAADLSADTAITGTSTQVMTINAAPSLMYYGAVSLTWTKGTKQLVDYYPNRTLTAITLPDAALKTFKRNFSDSSATITAHDTSVPFTSASTTAVAIVNLLISKVGLAFTLGATTTPGVGLYDLSGFTLSINSISQVADANPDYRQVAILTPPAVYGNQYTPLYLHYDYRSVIETSSIITQPVLSGLTA